MILPLALDRLERLNNIPFRMIQGEKSWAATRKALRQMAFTSTKQPMRQPRDRSSWITWNSQRESIGIYHRNRPPQQPLSFHPPQAA